MGKICTKCNEMYDDKIQFCTNCGRTLISNNQEGEFEKLVIKESPLLAMFPNEIKPCEGEIKVKAYHCAKLQSKFFKTTKAEGVLTITNKRVIFRTKGIINDNNFLHSELPIEDVAGITVAKGKFFDLIKFVLIYLFGIPLLSLPFVVIDTISRFISTFLGIILKLSYNQANTLAAVIYVLLLIGFIVFVVLLTRKNAARFKELGLADKGIIQKALSLLNPFRPALTLKIISKGGEQGVINISVEKKFGFIDLSADAVPTDTAISMMKEVGAVINDIQKLGDLGIEKWKKK